jgi:methionyl-tRNA formyltransferase
MLQRLIEGEYDVVGVYTAPDREAGRGRKLMESPVKRLALANGLAVFQPTSLRPPEAVAELASLRPDVIVIAAYGQILRQPVLDLPPKGVLNVHPSLLPRHRGASPIPATILAGDEQTGVTILQTEAGIDSGPILSQRTMLVEPADTAGSLSSKLAKLGADVLIETLPGWVNGTLQASPQDDSLATYAPMLRKEEGLIDWNRPAVDIWRRVRAYNPWPGAYTTLGGEAIHVWEAWPLNASVVVETGTVVALDESQSESVPASANSPAFAVQTGDGLLAVISLQRAGRKAMAAQDFLRGQRDFLGRRLGE